MGLNKTSERNRLEPVGSDSTHRFLDSAPEILFASKNNSIRIASFTADLRPILRSFFSEESVPACEIESLTEDIVDRFRDGRSIRSWRRTAPYRHLVLGLLLVNFFDETNEVGDIVSFTKQFSMKWREYLLSKSWENLKQKELETGRPYFSVLRSRYQRPWLTNQGLLLELSSFFETTPTKQAFRVFLHRCEQHFAHEILAAVTRTIHLPNAQATHDELIALDLIQFQRQ